MTGVEEKRRLESDAWSLVFTSTVWILSSMVVVFVVVWLARFVPHRAESLASAVWLTGSAISAGLMVSALYGLRSWIGRTK
jgi:hypothetical protein